MRHYCDILIAPRIGDRLRLALVTPLHFQQMCSIYNLDMWTMSHYINDISVIWIISTLLQKKKIMWFTPIFDHVIGSGTFLLMKE